jgi:flagellar hook assembly protein FlgD
MRRIRIPSLFLSLILVLIAFGLKQQSSEASEHALIQIDFFQPDVDHLTKGYAQSQWGVDLFSYPYGITQGYFLQGDDLLNIVTLISDHGFDRITYCEPWGNDPNWIRGYGGVGSGLGQFFSPSGIVLYNRPNDNMDYHYIYVTDTWNNRIISFTYDWSSEQIISISEITSNGLLLPKAIDINNGGDFGNPANDRIWVANGDKTVKKFDLDGNLLLTYDGDGHFGLGNLTGISCGKSYFTDPSPPYERFANNNDIYVATSSALLQFCEVTPGIIEFRRKLVLPSPIGWSVSLTSVETDNFGHVWATVIQEQNGTGHQESYIGKLTSNLDKICNFNAGGTLNYPQCFSNTGGNEGCGNSLLLEEWDDESGALNYVIGTDIMNLSTGSNEEHYLHFVDYELIDPSWVTVKVYDEEDVLIKWVPEPDTIFEFTGWNQHWWNGTDENNQIVPSGNYKIEIAAHSVYQHFSSGEPINSVIKVGLVYHIDYNEPLNIPTITSIEAQDTSLCIYWEDNNINELGYIIERKDDTDILWIVIDTTSWDVESYVDYSIMGSETYYYRIRACNYYLQSDYSNIMSKKSHPFPPLNVFAENFYCNRPYRPIKKVSGFSPQIEFHKSWDEHCEPAYPDSIPSDVSGFYADYPVNQKPGTFVGMEVWSKSCKWHNHNYVKYETTFVNLNRPMLIHTPPDTEYCTDWNYYFMVRTVDTFGDTSIFSPHCWEDASPVCVGPCHVQIGGSSPIMKPEVPSSFCLGQNHPNPFNPQTLIRYGLPNNSEVNLIIYNILGQKVRTLVDENQIAGYKTVIWDGKDESGDQVASGIYFCRLRAGNYTEVRKMVMLK